MGKHGGSNIALFPLPFGTPPRARYEGQSAPIPTPSTRAGRERLTTLLAKAHSFQLKRASRNPTAADAGVAQG